MFRTKSSLKDAMKSIGLSPRHDKHIYAAMLDLAQVDTPRCLRGSKRDSSSGFKWKREFEFIIKHRYGFLVKDIISSLLYLLSQDFGKEYFTKDPPVTFGLKFIVGRMMANVQVDMETKTILSCVPVNFR